MKDDWMPNRFEVISEKAGGGSLASRGELDLDPPYDQHWPSWVLRVRRRRWTALPVLEVCALLLCLAAILGLSRQEAVSPLDSAPEVTEPFQRP